MQQLLVGGGESRVVGDGLDERLDDLRVEHRSTRRDLAHGACELVALGDPVLEEVCVPRGSVGEQGDRVVGVVVLREDDDSGARVPLAELLGGVDALLLEARWHADIGHEHLGSGGLGTGDQGVVVVGRTHHFDVVLEPEERAHPLPHDDVVIGQEHGDPAVPHIAH